MSLKITIEMHEWEDLLDRHIGVGPRAHAALDAVLAAAFAESQSVVHVITGRLKASGRSNAHVSGESWHGEVTYDASHHGHYYAGYEQRRGGAHDFMAPLQTHGEEFAEAMLADVQG